MGMRNNMVQTLGEDYTRLARAKGLKPAPDRPHGTAPASRSCRT